MSRNGTMLPWDDDMDVVIPWEAYEDFMEVIDKMVGNKSYVVAIM